MVTRFRPLLVLALLSSVAACPRLGPGDRGDSCSNHEDCESDLVCVDDECDAPWGERWRLTIERANFGQRDGQNDLWDGDGLPDPYIIVRVDNAELMRTSTRPDSRSPTWSQSISVPLFNNTLVEMIVMEENFLLDRAVVTTGNAPVSISDLRAGQNTVFAVLGDDSPDAGNVNDRTVTLTYRWDLE